MIKNKNYSLRSCITIIFSCVIISFSFIMALFTPSYLNNEYKKSVFNTIKKSIITAGFKNEFSEDIRDTQHLILNNHGDPYSTSNFSTYVVKSFIEQISHDAINQKYNSKEYIFSSEDYRILYMINKFDKGYLVSFKYDFYVHVLINKLEMIVIILAVIFIVIGVLLTRLLAKFLTRPLNKINKQIEDITKLNWEEKLNMDCKFTELNSLAENIEKMRLELINQDYIQKEMFQNISHDLKTPIMVINSYAECIKEEFYPKGDINSSMDVIIEETKRLENKVMSLLYLSKLDRIDNTVEIKKVNISEIINKVVDKFKIQNNKLIWTIKLSDISFDGDEEMWEIVFENLIQNFMRYADQEIKIILNSDGLSFYNDGKHINDNILENIFDAYKKDVDGVFGLGLSIVKRVVILFGYEISAQNEEKGVTFLIR
ncbi:MAG: sensor histidine kinase [Bacilli bacterium]